MKKRSEPPSPPPSVGSPPGEASSPASSAAQLSSLNPQPPSIPDHELLKIIGGGSYGEVWLARSAMGTYRAVKIVHRMTFDHDRPFEREFAGIQKFEPISRSHEGLVDLLQVGRNEADGYFYYVMELADSAEDEREKGRSGEGEKCPSAPFPPFSPANYAPLTLRRLLRPDSQPSTLNPQPTHTRLPLDECIQLGLSLTNALAYLHGQGLVHRDIKPSNIIFVGGVPKLADVGLVADVGDARSYVGTEGFIPPEGPGSPQADLYSLGIVLYEMSTGKSHQDFPEPLADLAGQPDHARRLELNAVIHKACRAEVRERYQSCEEMLADLELLHVGGSVKRRQVWRHGLNATAKPALVFGAVALVSAITYWLSDWRSQRSDSARSGLLEFTWSTNEAANEEFRKGMQFLQASSNANTPIAIQHFQRATELDSNFADAFAYLARAWMAFSGVSNQFANARLAAEKAVSLNTNSALGHSVLATVRLGELDWAGADAARRRALDLAPNSEDILLTSALNLATMGRSKEALATLEKARRVAPGSASSLRTIYSGFVLAWSGEYDRALEIFNQVHGTYYVKEQHAQAYLGKEDYPNAIRLERQAALARGGNTNEVNAEFDALEKALAGVRDTQNWRRKLGEDGGDSCPPG